MLAVAATALPLVEQPVVTALGVEQRLAVLFVPGAITRAAVLRVGSRYCTPAEL